MALVLAPVLDTPAAGLLRISLRQAADQRASLLLDGGGVERVGLACLQVLAAGRAAAAAAGIAFTIADPSPPLIEMATLAGLDDLLA